MILIKWRIKINVDVSAKIQEIFMGVKKFKFGMLAFVLAKMVNIQEVLLVIE